MRDGVVRHGCVDRGATPMTRNSYVTSPRISSSKHKQAQEEQQMNSVIRNGTRHPARALAVGSGVFIALSLAGCADAPGDNDDELIEFASTEQSITAVGDALPGTNATDFAEAKTAFATQEEIE